MRRGLALFLLLLPLPPTKRAMSRDPAYAVPAWLKDLHARYVANIRVAGLEDRAFSPEHWWDVATPLATEARGFRMEEVGRSAEGRPLRHVSWGRGKTRVLLWSQMHGDESTASMAIADLFRFLGDNPDDPIVRRLRDGTTLDFLPVMNPDGAARFQRRLKLELAVEVILDDALVAPGDEDEVLDPRLARLIHRILDQRPVHHGQHFLGHGLGGRKEPRAKTGNGKHGGADALGHEFSLVDDEMA